jgi:hypothetical protein
MREVSEPGLIETLSPLFEEAKKHAIVVRDGGTSLGAIVSMEDFEIVRKANIQKFFELCDLTGEEIAAKAAEQGVPIEEIQRYLLSDED